METQKEIYMLASSRLKTNEKHQSSPEEAVAISVIKIIGYSAL
jgi:hypothetical protein